MNNAPRRTTSALLGALLLVGAQFEPAAAQTDFYNLDKDRPLRVEDAYATKRGALELQLSPLTLEQERLGDLHYRPAIELKYGLLPGVEVSLGHHFDVLRRRGDAETHFGGLELSALGNLWVESAILPAAALRATAVVPLERDAGAAVELRGLLTRSLRGPVRAHLNGAWLVGDGRTEAWWAGLALDYVFPFQHTLLLVETWWSEGVAEDDSGTAADSSELGALRSAVGLRTQLSPTLALDAGVGGGWTGRDRNAWMLTLGITYEFALRGLLSGSVR